MQESDAARQRASRERKRIVGLVSIVFFVNSAEREKIKAVARKAGLSMRAWLVKTVRDAIK